MADKQIFNVVLEKHETMDATGITIPFDVEKVFGAKRIPVKVSINGAEHHSTIVRMGGKYMVGVPKEFREAAGIKAGETITVEIERDTEKRSVQTPEDLKKAISKANLSDVWKKLSYTHQKEYVRAVNETKKEETRIRRIEKTIEELR